jgi:hypothetical protein
VYKKVVEAEEEEEADEEGGSRKPKVEYKFETASLSFDEHEVRAQQVR